MKNIADFSPTERQLVSQTLFERYGRQVPLEDADAELALEPDSDELTTCPTLYWEERGAHFVVFKTGNSRFRAQFFYSEAQQFGTGKEEFDNLGDCLITLLQVQSDHERQMKGIRSGMTALDFDEDYTGPLIV
ncbi:MAG: hypothetical protein AB7U81_07800 [Thiohalomonadaceae bacterium]